MDPKLMFWTGALANMGAVVALAALGVWARRRGDIVRHSRLMLSGGALVSLFLLSYLVKLVCLGREDMETWSSGAVWLLRVHETCVLVMLVAGFLAARRGMAMARTRNVTRDPSDPPAAPERVRGHRLAGWTAASAAVAGFLAACLVLFGMYERAGLV